jgi:hypothetical protein
MANNKLELPIWLDAPLKGVGATLALWIALELSAQFMSAFTSTDSESTFSTLSHMLYSDNLSQSHYDKPIAWGSETKITEWSGSDRVWHRIFGLGTVTVFAGVTCAAFKGGSNNNK